MKSILLCFSPKGNLYLLAILLLVPRPAAQGASTTVAAWGGGTSNIYVHPHYGQSRVPENLLDVRQVSAGNFQSFVIRDDQTVAAWGWTNYNQTAIPPGLANVVALAPGWYHTVALRSDRTVSAWGWGFFGETSVPPDLTNAVAVAAGDSFSLALRSDGTVVYWGLSFITPPAGLSNVVAIAAGKSHALALKADGTLALWGDTGLYSAPGYNVYDMPSGLRDIVAVAAGEYQSIVLTADGSVVTWGQWSGPAVPAGLTNVAAVATGGHNLALTRDGSVVAWGYDEYGQGTVPAGISNAIGIAAGRVHSLALLGDGSPIVARELADRSVYSGTDTSFSAGVVGAPPLSYQWQFDNADLAGATYALLTLTNVQSPDAGSYRVVVTSPKGTVNTANARLSVILSPPRLQQQPASRLVALSSNLTLAASAVGSQPMAFQWRVNEIDIPNATNPVLNLIDLTLAAEGSYRCLITNLHGATLTSNAFINVVDLPETLNTPAFTWTSSGDLPWIPQFSTTHDSFAAAQSGAIGHGQQSAMETTLNGPGALTFWWRVSSETNDFLSVSVNGVTQAAISGGAGWRQKTVYLGFGAQTVRFLFCRDASGSAGGDVAWIDQVSFAPGTTPAGIAIPPASQLTWLRNPTTLTAAGSGTPPLKWQWQFQGTDIPGATESSRQIPSATFAHAGSYRVRVTNDYGGDWSSNAQLRVEMVAAWGDNTYGQTNLPSGLTNLVGIATGGYHNLAVRNDGTVVAWGRNDFGETNVPPGLSNVVAVAAGYFHSLALTSNGTVVAWGWNTSGQTNVPPGLSNTVSILCGGNLSAAIDSRGAIWLWGYNNIGAVPAAASNAVAVAPASYNAAALRSDGRLVLWPRPGPSGMTFSISPLSNIVSITAGGAHLLALTEDHTVAGGCYQCALTNFPGPADVVALAAGSIHSLLLRSDGTVSGFGDNAYGQIRIPPRLTNVVAVAAGERVSLALLSDGSPFFLQQPVSRMTPSGGAAKFLVAAASSEPLSYQWRWNGADIPGATTSVLSLSNIPLTSAGIYHCIISNRLGTLTSAPASLAVLRSAPRFEGSPQLTPAGLHLALTGLSGHGETIIYGSTNLTYWKPLWTNPPALGSQSWTDPAATGLPLRFYRAEER